MNLFLSRLVLCPALLAGSLGLCASACSGDERLVLVGTGEDAFRTHADGGVLGALEQLDPDSEAAEIVRGYDELLTWASKRAHYSCECEHQTTEGQEFENCLNQWNPPTPPPVLECIRQVLAESPHVLPSLNCELKVSRTYVECVLAAPSCTDFTHITDCEIGRITDDLECEPFPYDIWAKSEKRCWGRERPPPFTCDNGLIISSERQCDIVDDCGDRSDEIGCKNDPHAGVEL